MLYSCWTKWYNWLKVPRLFFLTLLDVFYEASSVCFTLYSYGGLCSHAFLAAKKTKSRLNTERNGKKKGGKRMKSSPGRKMTCSLYICSDVHMKLYILLWLWTQNQFHLNVLNDWFFPQRLVKYREVCR